MKKLFDKCCRCTKEVDSTIFAFSTKKYSVPLCLDCQKQWFENSKTKETLEAKQLFLSLKFRNVDIVLEYDDGHKHVDLSIPEHNLHIEVDGSHHTKDATQALTDIKRTLHSLQKGFYTIRIPNILINENLEDIADSLVDYLSALRKKIKAK